MSEARGVWGVIARHETLTCLKNMSILIDKT
jgi:hypothetical protein